MDSFGVVTDATHLAEPQYPIISALFTVTANDTSDRDYIELLGQTNDRLGRHGTSVVGLVRCLDSQPRRNSCFCTERSLSVGERAPRDRTEMRFFHPRLKRKARTKADHAVNNSIRNPAPVPQSKDCWTRVPHCKVPEIEDDVYGHTGFASWIYCGTKRHVAAQRRSGYRDAVQFKSKIFVLLGVEEGEL